MSKESKGSDIAFVLANSKILVDTCFLMHPACFDFINNYETTFESSKILVSTRVIKEVDTLIKRSHGNQDQAKVAKAILEAAFQKKIAEPRGEGADSQSGTADQVILRVIYQHISQHDIVVLTQDHGLMKDVFNIRSQNSFNVNRQLNVIRLAEKSRKPHIVTPDFLDNGSKQTSSAKQSPTGNTTRKNTNEQSKPNKPVPKPFAKANKIEQGIDQLITVNEELKEGGILSTGDGKPVRLVKQVGRGGEGTIYVTEDQSVLCKIYHTNRLTEGAKKKIELMSTRQLSDHQICWPIASVYDSTSKFRGFIMSKAEGSPLAHGLFIPALWKKQQPNWTRRESVQIVLSILEKVKDLYSIGVLMGDINPQNILVKDEYNVYFVDCDSYQVEGFPCPVGAINFVAPEIQGQDFSNFIRKEEHELFAIATLIFMIMLPGKQPYSHQGGTNAENNIRKMHFPYPLGEKKSAQAPDGVWRFCWSHLTYGIKEAFFQTFHTDYRDKPRTAISDWIRLFEGYQSVLNKPDAVFVGPTPQYGFDLSILPENYRYVEGKEMELPTDGVSDLERVVRKVSGRTARSVGSRQSRTNHRKSGGVKQRPIWTSAGQKKPKRPTQKYSTSPNPKRNMGRSGQKSQDPCFVATAVYENESHSTVAKLRSYRDQELIMYPAGRLFIATYRKVGPYGARVVSAFTVLRRVLKPVLTWLAENLPSTSSK